LTNETLEKIKAAFGYEPEALLPEKESKEYEACRFRLNRYQMVFRSSKITPTKTGQFVTIWKRTQAGPIAPLHENDSFDFVLIHSAKKTESGFFVFPKSVLVQKRIVSSPMKEGKRGIRVYAPWDNVESKQAKKTQEWQLQYFLSSTQSDGHNYLR